VEELTIVLVVKNNHKYTLRWLDYMKAMKCKFKIMIADSSDNNNLPILIRQNKFDDSLFIQHRYYDFDEEGYEVYVKKKIDSLRDIDTKYMIFADNDDFYDMGGIERSIEFLNENQEYSSCGGRTGFFELMKQDKRSKYNCGKYYLSYVLNTKGILNEKSEDRIAEFFNGVDKNYYYAYNYNLIRKDVAVKISQAASNAKVDDPLILELLFNLILLKSGKVKMLNHLYYMRQLGTSILTSSLNSAGGNMERLIRLDGINILMNIARNSFSNTSSLKKISTSIEAWCAHQRQIETSKGPVHNAIFSLKNIVKKSNLMLLILKVFRLIVLKIKRRNEISIFVKFKDQHKWIICNK
jgi:glycosyltransferase domain-containing protein